MHDHAPRTQAPNTSDSDGKHDRECGAMVILKCAIVFRKALANPAGLQ